MYLKAPIAISSSLYVWVKEVVHKLGKLREVYDRHKYEKNLSAPKIGVKIIFQDRSIYKSLQVR